MKFYNSVYGQYPQNITDIEKGLVVLRQKKMKQKARKKAISETIKKADESVEVIKIVLKSVLKYNSSFAEGLQVRQ